MLKRAWAIHCVLPHAPELCTRDALSEKPDIVAVYDRGRCKHYYRYCLHVTRAHRLALALRAPALFACSRLQRNRAQVLRANLHAWQHAARSIACVTILACTQYVC